MVTDGFKVIGFMIDSMTTMETVRQFLPCFADDSFYGLRLYQPVLVVTTDLDAKEYRRKAINREFLHILNQKIAHAKMVYRARLRIDNLHWDLTEEDLEVRLPVLRR